MAGDAGPLDDPSGARVWVAFGGNLGDAPAAMQAARRVLAGLPGVRFAGASSLWRSPALYAPGDSEPQPDYANAVAGFVVDTGGDPWSRNHAGPAAGVACWTPETFLDRLQACEDQAGRDRARPRWRARPLDLDLLWWERASRKTATLTLPHPEASRRAFVVIPWAEMAPDLVLAGAPLATLAAGFSAHGMVPWTGTAWDTLAA